MSVKIGDKVILKPEVQRSLALAGVRPLVITGMWTITDIVNGYVVTDEKLDERHILNYTQNELTRYPFLAYRRFNVTAVKKVL